MVVSGHAFITIYGNTNLHMRASYEWKCPDCHIWEYRHPIESIYGNMCMSVNLYMDLQTNYEWVCLATYGHVGVLINEIFKVVGCSK